MKKVVIILILMLVLTGCTAVRIDTNSIDNIIKVVLSKDNKLYNRIGKGYKYYVPRGVNYIDTDELNDKLYSNGNYYYLYVDSIGYYYNVEHDYKDNPDAFYSKVIDIDGKKGYLEINKIDNTSNYYIVYEYNYARIEAIVDEKYVNETVLNSTYILSTIKFNNKVIKLMMDDDYFTNKEEQYNLFKSKNEASTFDSVQENTE